MVENDSEHDERRENPLLPAFSVPNTRYLHRTRGPGIVKRFVDRIEYLNTQRLDSIRGDVQTVQVWGPHLTQMDYMIAHEATYSQGLNPLRVAVGKNLMSPLYRRSLQIATGIDLPEWGILLKDRDNHNIKEMLQYVSAFVHTLTQEGLSVAAWYEGGYPEGGRDHKFKERGTLREVPESFFLPALKAQRIMEDKPLKLLCVSPWYSGIPEDGYWDLIKNSRWGARFWDAVSLANWVYGGGKKGHIARVNFSEPRDISEIATGKNVGERTEKLAAYAHETITGLYREMAR